MASADSPAFNRSSPRRPRLFPLDLIFKVVALLVSIVVVWFVYAIYVRPAVADVAAETRVQLVANPNYTAPRSLAVILKDYEQQTEMTLFLWATILLASKLTRIGSENKMLQLRYLDLETGERILPDDSLAHYKELQSVMSERPSWHERILPNVILAALHRFHSTRSIQDAAQSIKERSDVAADELEADLSLIRYIVWAIPSVGFIGTVRGIGEALAQAQKALQGDISGVTDALGLAFNSTLVALILSLGLMFLLHLLQGRQDKLILDIQNFCNDHVVEQMKIPAAESNSPAFPA